MSSEDNSREYQRRFAQLQERERELLRWERALQQREDSLPPVGSDGKETPEVEAGSPSSLTADESKGRGISLSVYFHSGRFLRSLVFGGLDGLTTTMVLVCSVSGISGGSHETPHVPAPVIFTLGAANAIADAFSMGMGELLSSLADGDTEGTSVTSKTDAIRNGVVMFLSFIVFGFLPLIAYASFFPFADRSARLRCAWFLVITGLFSLGILKGHVTAGEHRGTKRSISLVARSGATMVITGGIASVLSYFVSLELHQDAPAGAL